MDIHLVNLKIQSEYRKTRTRNTSNMDIFYVPYIIDSKTVEPWGKTQQFFQIFENLQYLH